MVTLRDRCRYVAQLRTQPLAVTWGRQARAGSQPRRNLVLLGVLAQSGDQLVLAHGRAALDLQLTGPVTQLLDTALLERAPVDLAVLLSRLGLLSTALGLLWLALVAERRDQVVLAHRGTAFD